MSWQYQDGAAYAWQWTAAIRAFLGKGREGQEARGRLTACQPAAIRERRDRLTDGHETAVPLERTICGRTVREYLARVLRRYSKRPLQALHAGQNSPSQPRPPKPMRSANLRRRLVNVHFSRGPPSRWVGCQRVSGWDASSHRPKRATKCSSRSSSSSSSSSSQREKGGWDASQQGCSLIVGAPSLPSLSLPRLSDGWAVGVRPSCRQPDPDGAHHQARKPTICLASSHLPDSIETMERGCQVAGHTVARWIDGLTDCLDLPSPFSSISFPLQDPLPPSPPLSLPCNRAATTPACQPAPRRPVCPHLHLLTGGHGEVVVENGECWSVWRPRVHCG